MSTCKKSYRSLDALSISPEQFEQILCPNLRTGVRMGFLNPDKEGWVTREELAMYLRDIGIACESVVEKILMDTAIKAGPDASDPSRINLIHFSGSFLDHESDTGILENSTHFSQVAFDRLKQYASNGKWFTETDLARAGKDYYLCPVNKKSLKGTCVFAAEFTALLQIYGREENGRKVIDVDAVQRIYQDNQFPIDYQLPNKTCVTTWSILTGIVKSLLLRFAVK